MGRKSSNTYQQPSGRPAVTRSTAASPALTRLTSSTSPGWSGAARVLASKRTHRARWRAPVVPATTTSGGSTVMRVRRSSFAYGRGSTGLSLVSDSDPPTDNLRVPLRAQICAGAAGVPVGQRPLFGGWCYPDDAFFSFTVAHVKPQAVPVISSGPTVRVKLTCSLGPPRAATWKINVRPSRIPSRTS
jgi:hypothetical protein